MVYGWIWIAVIVLAVIVEALTDQLISIWFVPAAIAATVLDFAGVDIIWQLLVFFLVALLGIVVGRSALAKYLKPGKEAKTNIEAIVGERCVVTEKINNLAGSGQAKVRGQVWSARSVTDDVTFEPGEILNIVAIEGVKLICKK